jgi:hypothetical protein
MRESIRLQWKEMAEIPLSASDHHAARAAISSLVDHLKGLLDERKEELARGPKAD